MLGILGKKSFGIDIGTQTIKISEVVRKNGRISVSNYVIWNDEIESVIQEKDSNVSFSVEKIAGIIQVMMTKSQMNISEIYISIPSYLAFSDIITMPLLSAEELISAVPLEAKQHIPTPLKDVQFDWINLGPNKAKDKYAILLIALPNTVMSKYIALGNALGIDIKGFELDVFSVIRSINLPKSQVCLIDIGARTSTVSIINADKHLQLMRSFDFGGNQMTGIISDLKKISINEAEVLKIQNGISGLDLQISEIIQSKVKYFIETEVVKVIQQSQDIMGVNVQDIVLMGGFVNMVGFVEFLNSIIKNNFKEQQINLSIAQSYPGLMIKGVTDLNKIQHIWHDLGLSIGVALKDHID